MNRVFLDYQSTTPVAPEVLEAMIPYFTHIYGNPSSTHIFGLEAASAVGSARKSIAEMWNVLPEEIIFTSGATESINMALKGYAAANIKKGRHLITTSIEHPAVLETMRYLEHFGFEVSYLPVDMNGVVDPEELTKAIRKDTILVSVMWVNNETGTVQPIEECALICREHGIPFHTDATQGIGKLPLDLRNVPVSFLSMSGHKLYAPKGVGIHFRRRYDPPMQMEVQMHGGSHEYGARSGTLNVPFIVGLQRAIQLVSDNMGTENNRISELKQLFLSTLHETGCSFSENLSSTCCVPHTLSISLAPLQSNTLLSRMREIAVSTGSACSSGSHSASHVLKALGLTAEAIRGSLRISFGRPTTQDEVVFAAQTISNYCKQLK
mgnify:CR=1 FL=1